MQKHIPEVLVHREKEIDGLGSILLPALRGESPSNVFIYGIPSTGKTVGTKFIGRKLVENGKELGRRVNFIYINCNRVDTHYRILQNIANHFIKNEGEHIPFTGLHTDLVFKRLLSVMDKDENVTIVVLDEIDRMKGDEALYTLSRMNEDLEKARLSIIGISNNLNYKEFLDSRVKSSLGEETIIFPPYDAEQLQDILQSRAKIALKPCSIEDDVVPLCSALAAQEHGDARRAIDLLRVSAELTERDGKPRITKNHVRIAHNKIEFDRITETVRILPHQSKLLLCAIHLIEKEKRKMNLTSKVTTGEVYDIYRDLCKKAGTTSLTQRRIADLISELDTLGIINARAISKGRQGRTREIKTSVELLWVLQEDELFKGLANYKINQTRICH